jgi:beta-lactamase class A
MEALGLPRTKVWHKVYKREVSSIAPDSSLAYGLGVTTPNEMARLYARLADGTAVNPRADSLALAILDQTEDLELLQRFAGGIRAAHKTGWVDAARTECTLWPLRGRVVACVFTKGNADERYDVDAEANVTIARMGEAVVRAWAPPQAPAAPLTR